VIVGVSEVVEKIVEIKAEVSEAQLDQDLEKYRQLALDLGATDAKIIAATDIIIDPRVRARCFSPRCPDYMTNLNCPPYAVDPEVAKKALGRYKYGIFILLRVPAEEQAGADYYEASKHRVPGAIKMYELVAKLQAAALCDRYHLAIAFGGGLSCKRALCPEMECSGITGAGCRFASQVTPSMHSVGMDVFTMAAKAGWDIFPIGHKIDPCQVPYGAELGLVLIY
jgi:predicted metal-binding protein